MRLKQLNYEPQVPLCVGHSGSARGPAFPSTGLPAVASEVRRKT